MKRLFLFLAAAVFISINVNSQEKVWANFARYGEANRQVLEAQSKGAKKPLAVLMGDSITDGWYGSDKDFFTDNNLIGRGISGQCTSHMLARFQRDVVELNPKYVAILAGINDIAHNDNYVDVEDAFLIIVSMCDIADRYGIKVVLCTTTPGNPTWRPHDEHARAGSLAERPDPSAGEGSSLQAGRLCRRPAGRSRNDIVEIFKRHRAPEPGWVQGDGRHSAEAS